MAKAKKSRKRSATASKKLAFSPKNIGKNAKNSLLPIALGFIAGNVATKLVPTKETTGKGLPAIAVKGLVAGAGVAGMGTNNAMISGIGAGMAMHGGFGLLNEVKTSAGVSGLADNPTVQKALDMLIPNLGSVAMLDHTAYDTDMDLSPITFDVPYTEEVEDPYAQMAISGTGNEYGGQY